MYFENTMTNDELVQQLQEAQALIAKQAARLAELEARLAELEQKLDEAQRRGKRQATPFSKILLANWHRVAARFPRPGCGDRAPTISPTSLFSASPILSWKFIEKQAIG
jgi:hypothetical protein